MTCEEDRAEKAFDPAYFPWFLKPAAYVQAGMDSLKKKIEGGEGSEEERNDWIKEWVKFRSILESGMEGRSKKDWGCVSGKCTNDLCEQGTHPAEKAFQEDYKDDSEDIPHRKEKVLSGVSAMALTNLCLITVTAAGLMLT
jgi:hypothetical protein